MCRQLGHFYVGLLFGLLCVIRIETYYAHHRCFGTDLLIFLGDFTTDNLFNSGTGDCIVAIGYLAGGFDDEYHRWMIECSDGEAMIGNRRS